jgi:hypothetical protein
MSADGSGADIREAIKRFLRDEAPPEGVDEKLVLKVLKVLEDYQFSVDRSRARDLIRKIIEGRR